MTVETLRIAYYSIQDGATPHYAQPVRQYLDFTFSVKWVEIRDAVEWSPRSPDLSFLRGQLKSNIK